MRMNGAVEVVGLFFFLADFLAGLRDGAEVVSTLFILDENSAFFAITTEGSAEVVCE